MVSDTLPNLSIHILKNSGATNCVFCICNHLFQWKSFNWWRKFGPLLKYSTNLFWNPAIGIIYYPFWVSWHPPPEWLFFIILYGIEFLSVPPFNIFFFLLYSHSQKMNEIMLYTQFFQIIVHPAMWFWFYLKKLFVVLIDLKCVNEIFSFLTPSS